MSRVKLTDKQVISALNEEPDMTKAARKLGCTYNTLYIRALRMGLRKVTRWEKR